MSIVQSPKTKCQYVTKFIFSIKKNNLLIMNDDYFKVANSAKLVAPNFFFRMANVN